MPERIEVDAGMAELIREALRLQEFYPALPPEFVVRQGESARDIYLIQTGLVEVRQTMGSMSSA